MEVTGKIRYNDDGAIGSVKQVSADEIEVFFPAGREAITPGQAVVLYEGEDVVAGRSEERRVGRKGRKRKRRDMLNKKHIRASIGIKQDRIHEGAWGANH